MMNDRQKLRSRFGLKGVALEIAHGLVLRNRTMTEAAWIGVNTAALREGNASAWAPPPGIPYAYRVE